MKEIYIFLVMTTIYLLLITFSLVFSKNRKLEVFFFTTGFVLMAISMYYPLFLSGWYKLLFFVGVFVLWFYLLKEEQIKSILT
ncbi:hypothetical protein EOM09_06045 [bacterium]|nr:hypothetical protein [bacterium]